MVAHLVADRYQIEEQVAASPRGVTYRAVDRETGELVAITLVDAAVAADPRFVAYFHRQAHGASELVEPNVTRLLDYGPTGKTYFLVEEWVEGTALGDYLAARGPLPVAETLAVGHAVAAALAAAHRIGLVHGGLTPEEIVIRADGVVKVGGFGMPKPSGLPALPETAASRAAAYYISPEQAQGEVPTPASDVYALGAVLYHMLAGRPPFEGATPLAIALKHVNEDPPDLRQLRPGVPGEVAALVMRALAKQPSRRYRDGADMERAIEALHAYRPGLLPLPVAVAGPSLWQRLSTPPVSWLAGLLLLLLIATLGGALLLLGGAALQQPPSPTPTVATVAMPNFVGRPLADAESFAKQHNLELNESGRPDAQAPQGTVVEQSPQPGQAVAPGGTVQVVVSQGPAQVEVPNLVGMDTNEARQTLVERRLRLGQQSERASSPEYRGRILGQDPPAGGRVAEGSPVNIVVGSGPAPTETPTVTPSPVVTPTMPPASPTATASPTPSPATPTASPSVTAAPSTPTPGSPTPTATTSTTPTAGAGTPGPSPSPSASPGSPTPGGSPTPSAGGGGG